jgi:hypothetical protein
MITFTERRHRPRRSRPDYGALATGQLLALHERHFGPLDRKSKQRIVDRARRNGWDQDFGMDGLAA